MFFYIPSSHWLITSCSFMLLLHMKNFIFISEVTQSRCFLLIDPTLPTHCSGRDRVASFPLLLVFWPRSGHQRCCDEKRTAKKSLLNFHKILAFVIGLYYCLPQSKKNSWDTCTMATLQHTTHFHYVVIRVNCIAYRLCYVIIVNETWSCRHQ